MQMNVITPFGYHTFTRSSYLKLEIREDHQWIKLAARFHSLLHIQGNDTPQRDLNLMQSQQHRL